MQYIKTICAPIAFFLGCFCLSLPANSANLVLEDPFSRFPTLLGVEDLAVNDSIYNVYFGRGTFNTLYLGINSDPTDPVDRVQADRRPFEFDISPDLFDNDPFVFLTAADAIEATSALVDAAFVGTVFDERPSLTNGCTQSASCSIFTPFGELGDTVDGRVNILRIDNANFESEDLDGSSRTFEDPDFRTLSDSTYALWFLTSGGDDPIDPAPVPLPPSVIAFLSGLFVFLNLSKTATGRR